MEKQKEMVRERIENYGAQSLFDSEAIAMLIGAKEEIFKEIKSLTDLQLHYKKLKLTKLQRQKIQIMFELHNRLNKEALSITAGEKLTSPKNIFELYKHELAPLKKEQFHVLLLDTKLRLIKSYCVSEGSLTSSIVHPREVFKEAILESAYAMICIHNHPSGDPVVSNEDISITKRLVETGKTIGINVLDHIIIAKEGFTSLKEDGYI